MSRRLPASFIFWVIFWSLSLGFCVVADVALVQVNDIFVAMNLAL